MSTSHPSHLDALQMQALLDGDLSAAQAADAQAHLEACEACRGEWVQWQALFGALDEVGSVAPSAMFEQRVMAAHAAAQSKVLAPRTHLSPALLQEHAEGLLRGRAARQATEHLAACEECRTELAAFSAVSLRLGELASLAPSSGFQERVLAAHRLEMLTALSMPQPARSTLRARMRHMARSLSGNSPRTWATVTGIALGPAILLALFVRAIFAHPLVTTETLLTFISLQVRPVLSSVLDSLVFSGAARVALLPDGLWSAQTLALGATLFTGSMLLASWVFWRNVFAPSSLSKASSHARIPF
jgi:anti-sigma factor RsiW